MQAVTSVRDAEVKDKRVLVRVDFNVPIQNGEVVDDSRIKAALPTLELLHANGAQKIIILTHLGRPKGKMDPLFELTPVENKLKTLTQVPFEMYENLRFDPREESNDESLAKELAALGDVYVNEAFSNSHRTHASMVALPKLLPHYIGLTCAIEVQKLSEAMNPEHPALAIMGGAKFDTKIPLITKILTKYDKMLLGGALANNMFKVRGLPVGASLVGEDMVPTPLAGDSRIELSVDAVLEGPDGAHRTGYINDTHAGERIVDVGPQTTARWCEEMLNSKFVLWNGPLGWYEKGYTQSTETLAKALAGSQVRAVVGGGDTAAALHKVAFDPERVFVSTGGGAMLEFLSSGTLPALDALRH